MTSTLPHIPNTLKSRQNHTPYMKAFLSHSSKDKGLAQLLKDKLSPHGIDVFVAHSDIKGGEDWEQILYNKINDCDIFLVLLTGNYHESSYTDQEVGMALAYDKPFYPISVDSVKPYGFMQRFQCTFCKPDLSDYEKIRDAVGQSKTPQDIIDITINNLENAYSSAEAARLAKILEPYSSTLTKGQVNRLALVYLYSHQIKQSFTAGSIIKNILVQNKVKINKGIRGRLHLI